MHYDCADDTDDENVMRTFKTVTSAGQEEGEGFPLVKDALLGVGEIQQQPQQQQWSKNLKCKI